MSKKDVGLVNLCTECNSHLRIYGELLACNNEESDHYAHVFFDKHPACKKFMIKILTEVKKGNKNG